MRSEKQEEGSEKRVKRDLCERTFRSTGRIVRLGQTLVGPLTASLRAKRSNLRTPRRHSVCDQWPRLLRFARNDTVSFFVTFARLQPDRPGGRRPGPAGRVQPTHRHPHHDRQEDQGERPMSSSFTLQRSLFLLHFTLQTSLFTLLTSAAASGESWYPVERMRCQQVDSIHW